MSSTAGTQKKQEIPIAILIMIGIGFLATTLGQPQVIGRLPLQNLLLNELHISQTQMASFFFMLGLPWYFKPFAGILTDAFPLAGTRRRWYTIIGCSGAVLSWIFLGTVPHQYSSLLYAALAVNTFMVVASTVLGAIMVEAGQTYSATGRLTSLRQFVQGIASIINGPLSGLLASGAFGIATGSGAVIVGAVIPFAWFYLREQRVAATDVGRFKEAGEQLKVIFRSKTLWIAAGFMFLLYVAPGFTTPLYYVQNNVLKFSQQSIGNLGMFEGGCALLAAVGYSQICKRLPLRNLLYIAVGLAALGALPFLAYTSYTIAIVAHSVNAFFFTLAELAVMDLALRSTPKGCEGLGFALLMSVRNLAIFGTDILGSKLIDDYKMTFHSLVILNAGSTALVLIFVRFLPDILVRGRDNETVPVLPAAKNELEEADLP
ncbi:MAG: MFS transporter [Armatimonadetes bacterium]|nr:MFS transporter [Armatimonadota bacterium]